MNKSITIKIIHIDKDKINGREIGGENENKIIDIPINKSIYLGMLTEMKKSNIVVDNDLQCFNNRIFTIFEREWIDAAPVFGTVLRKDLEMIICQK